LAGDRAVAWLAERLGPGPDEVVANRIGLLVQACDATAGLIGNAVNHALRRSASTVAAWSTTAILVEVLRYDPPVRLTRRIAREPVELAGAQLATGAELVLRFDVANRDPAVFAHPGRFAPDRDNTAILTFGHGPRRCPGDPHALAIAAGVLDALRSRCRRVRCAVDYEPSPNLRIPMRLEVTLT
jgi:cytochrome P450